MTWYQISPIPPPHLLTPATPFQTPHPFQRFYAEPLIRKCNFLFSESIPARTLPHFLCMTIDKPRLTGINLDLSEKYQTIGECIGYNGKALENTN